MGCNSCVDTSLRKSIKLLRPDMVEWLLTLDIYNKTDIKNELIIHSKNIDDRSYTDESRRKKVDKITQLLRVKIVNVARIIRSSYGLVGALESGGHGGSVKRKYKKTKKTKKNKKNKKNKKKHTRRTCNRR